MAHSMAGMDSGKDQSMMRLMDQMQPKSFVQQIEHHASSGTSAEPNSTPGADGNEHEGRVDADVSRECVCVRHATVESAR